jgi:TolB-like protein
MVRIDAFASGGLASASPPPDECRAQLDRILKSADFDATERSRKFVDYVVSETLAGRADRIKAYAIAVEVFGREPSFEPQSDPIVRIEAAQLRRQLERYYLKAGQADPIVITIPKGGYVPVFALRSPPGGTPPAPPVPSVAIAATLALSRKRLSIWPWLGLTLIAALVAGAAIFGIAPAKIDLVTTPNIPKLLVEPFADLSAGGNLGPFARGLTQEIVGQLTKYKDISVFEVDSRGAAAPSGAASTLRYAVGGSVDVSEDKVRVRARLLNRADGSVVWAKSYDSNLKVTEILRIETDVAGAVATALAQPYGVIFQADAARKFESPPDDWEAYACTLSYYAYRATLDAKTHPTVRKCLESAVARFPKYATAWALLSQTYVDEIRFRYPTDPSSTPPSIDRALAAARRAVALEPENVRGLQAEMFALYFNQEIDAAIAVGKRAMILNPNDTELMGEYGFRLALSGDWEQGCPLIGEARERNPGPLAYYEAALSLCAYFRRDYQQAAMWIKKTPAPENNNYHIIAAAVFGEGGFTTDAERERDWLLKNAPALMGNVRKELLARVARPEDRERLISSLRKAGILIPE